jgi:hypothetical protein
MPGARVRVVGTHAVADDSLALVPRRRRVIYRQMCVVIALAARSTLAQSPAEVGTVPLVPDRWTVQKNHSPGHSPDSVRFADHLGRPSLILQDGFAFASGVDLQNGTLEADVATAPGGQFFGLGFHVQSVDKYEIIFFRPTTRDGTIQYTPSFFNTNVWQFYPGPEYTASLDFPVGQWVHVRLVIKGLDAAFYVDTATTPTILVHDLALGTTGGSVGFWGREGGGYVSNIRYHRDTVSYPTKPTHRFAQGAVTEGWQISDAYPVTEVDPGSYPLHRMLRWEAVQAEREEFVNISRYRRDPRGESPEPSPDGPAPATPGTEVVFARTSIKSDRDTVRKMWVGYSDDVVVYLNRRPLYAGRNSIGFRDPHALGWFYPYADAVYLPLKRGSNELLLAVSEAFGGWGFMCRFGP